VLGYRAIVNGIIKLAEVSATALGTDRAVGLPAFNVTVEQLMAALKNAAGNRHLGEHIMQKNDQITAICAGCPRKIDGKRALSLGLPMDESLEQIVHDYMEDYLN